MPDISQITIPVRSGTAPNYTYTSTTYNIKDAVAREAIAHLGNPMDFVGVSTSVTTTQPSTGYYAELSTGHYYIVSSPTHEPPIQTGDVITVNINNDPLNKKEFLYTGSEWLEIGDLSHLQIGNTQVSVSGTVHNGYTNPGTDTVLGTGTGFSSSTTPSKKYNLSTGTVHDTPGTTTQNLVKSSHTPVNGVSKQPLKTTDVIGVQSSTTSVIGVSGSTSVTGVQASTTSVIGVQSSTTSVTGVQASTTTASKASSASVTGVTGATWTGADGNGVYGTFVEGNLSIFFDNGNNISGTVDANATTFTNVTVPIKDTSATTVPIKATSSTTVPIKDTSATTVPIADESATTVPIKDASATAAVTGLEAVGSYTTNIVATDVTTGSAITYATGALASNGTGAAVVTGLTTGTEKTFVTGATENSSGILAGSTLTTTTTADATDQVTALTSLGTATSTTVTFTETSPGHTHTAS